MVIDDGMVKGKKEKERVRDMDPLYKIMHVGFPVGSGMQAFEILTIKNVPDKCLLMSCSRRMQILYRADAFLIGYGNKALLVRCYCLMKPCGHDAGELVGMLHAHVSAAQKNLVMWCLGNKHMLHRCVFF